MKKALTIVLVFALVMAALYGLDSLVKKEKTPDAEKLASQEEEKEETTVVGEDGLDLTSATRIVLSDKGSSVAGTGAALSGSDVIIGFAGVYVLSGTLTDGQIVVNCEQEGAVYLVLDGADVCCGDGPALYVKQADLTVIQTLADTANRLSDGDGYALVDGAKTQPNAALYSCDELLLRGEGVLTIEGNYNNGVRCRDGVTVDGGTLRVTAVNDGVKANDGIVLNDGTVSVTAGGDGVQTTSALPDQGSITLNGGTWTLQTAGDGFAAAGDLTVAGGTVSVVAAQGSAHYDEMAASGVSAKGMKAASITVLGGEITLDTADDGLHARGACVISGGTLTVASGDEGVQAKDSLTVTGGTINVTASYQALEAVSVRVEGGLLNLTAQDDGLRASAGDVLQGQSGEACAVTIAGGLVNVRANRAVNADGGFLLTGGLVTLESAEPLQCSAASRIDGGSLLAVGSLGQTNPFSDGSAQCSVLYGFSASREAGTTLTLTLADTDETSQLTPASAYDSILVSVPDLTVGQTCTLTAGDESAEVTPAVVNDAQFAPAPVAETNAKSAGMPGDGGMPGM